MAKRFHNGNNIRKQGMDYIHSQERQDGAMIREDYNCMSLLPYNVIIKEYPKNNFALHDELNDTITGIDRQINGDVGQIKRALSPKKY